MATKLKNLSDYNPNDIPNAEDKIFGIVVSEWNTEITNALLEGSLEALGKAGVKQDNIIIHYVPGTYELAYGAQRMILSHHPHAVICLGCVIQGETRHFDFICQAAADGIMQVSLNHQLPVIFGVLTTNDLEQAQARSGGKHGNKGFEAGITALKLI
jgi:6,7-dimethyl-8-ribityllumazine synthase